MVKTSLVSLVLSVFLGSLLLPVSVVAAEPVSAEPEILISEVKVRNDASGYDEFIEIYNTSSEPLALSDFFLEYFNVAFPGSDTSPTSKFVSTGLLEANSFLTLAKQPIQIADSLDIPFSSLKDTEGRLRIVDVNGLLLDEVAWTNSASLATGGVVLITDSTDGNKTKSISKPMDAQNVPIFDSEWILDIPTPTSSPLLDPPSNSPEPIIGNCDGVIISELLPNPAGADARKEFIELHNPTGDFISLEGCGLQLAGKSHVHLFGEVELVPGQYRAFYDSETAITLPNASGGSVWLLEDDSELQEVSYPGGLDDDVAWAWFGGNDWASTYTPTPHAKNVLQAAKPCPAGQERNPDTGRCRNIATAESSLKPCRSDQERNPETNRCRKIGSAVSALKPCNADQERNPETNRCRKLATSTLKPCNPDQERNPETNRCRKIGSNTLKPCKPGQARNPETNRCRKVALAGVKDGGVQDVIAPTHSSLTSWWVAGAALVGALGYGVFEWRKEITRTVGGLKNIFTAGAPPRPPS